MVLKTFNVEAGTYDRFSSFCREYGISMSKQIDIFMKSFVEKDPQARKEYLDRLDKVRKGKFVRVASFEDRYLR